MEHVDAYVIFGKVGDLSSISGAARALNIPKATVSRAIARLEAAYKVKLFERTSQRIVLTQVGRTLHARSKQIVEHLEEAEAEIAVHRNHPTGTLRVGCSADVANVVLANSLHEFLDRYPEIDFRLQIADRLMPESGGLDVVLHAGWLLDSWLIARKILTIPTILVASRTYVEERGLPRAVDDLETHPVIGSFFVDRSTAEAWRLPAHVPQLELKRGSERHLVPLWSRFMSTDQMTSLSLARRGRAIAPVARLRIGEELRSGELVHVLPDYEIVDPPVLSVVYSNRAAVAPKISVFVKFVSEIVSKLVN